ncbi:MAG: hypothetical protein OEY96_02250 [Gammaproteobacteria bacterium]|nr:hypothetical protein [Gammaproteobacteria bacterium]
MQSINFYFPQYQPKPLSFDSRFSFLVVTIFTLSMLLFIWLDSQHISQLNYELESQNQQISRLQSQLVEQQNKLGITVKINELESELLTLQNELTNYREISNLIRQPVGQSRVKYSQILADLAKKNIDTVWLTKIILTPEYVSLFGSSTDSKQIPGYVDQLKKYPSLKRYFDEFVIQRNENKAHIVAFELLNGRLVNDQ